MKAYDPIAMRACRELHPSLKIRYCQSVKELALDADALVVVTEWNEFRNLPLADLAELMASPVLVDGRNIFSPEGAMAAGFDYAGIGRNPRNRAENREARRAAARSVT